MKWKHPSKNVLIHRQTRNTKDKMEKIQKYREDFAKIEAATEIENFD